MKLITVAEIKQQYPDEWALLEIVHDRIDTQKVAGRLLAHSPDRDDLDEPHQRFRAEHPRALLFEFFTGDLVADKNVVIIL